MEQEIREFFITFGVKYGRREGDEKHPLGMYADGYAVIEAPSESVARTITQAIFGEAWAFMYTSVPMKQYAKAGELLRIRWVYPSTGASDAEMRELHHFEVEEENASLKRQLAQVVTEKDDLLRKYRERAEFIAALREDIEQVRAQASHLAVTRIEVIDKQGRSYVGYYDQPGADVQIQDDGQTLKVFAQGTKQ